MISQGMETNTNVDKTNDQNKCVPCWYTARTERGQTTLELQKTMSKIAFRIDPIYIYIYTYIYIYIHIHTHTHTQCNRNNSRTTKNHVEDRFSNCAGGVGFLRRRASGTCVLVEYICIQMYWFVCICVRRVYMYTTVLVCVY